MKQLELENLYQKEILNKNYDLTNIKYFFERYLPVITQFNYSAISFECGEDSLRYTMVFKEKYILMISRPFKKFTEDDNPFIDEYCIIFTLFSTEPREYIMSDYHNLIEFQPKFNNFLIS